MSLFNVLQQIASCAILFLFPIHVASADIEEQLNQEPIIAVVSQEIPNHYLPFFPAHTSFISASYVKAVESSGARVVPMVTGKPESYYRNLLSSVNGVVLPGGGATHGIGNPYYDAVRTIYKIAKEINANGTIFPILAVCLGFEFVLNAANNDESVVKRCNIFYENFPLQLTKPVYQIKQFTMASLPILHTLRTKNSTMNWHRWCVFEEEFNKSSLPKEWTVTSTSVDRNGTEFIATVEHKNYPFFGVQFHPEKIAFEWKREQNIPRGSAFLEANRYFYDHIVELSRNNHQKFATKKEERDSLIYNYIPRYDVDENATTNTQMYLF